MRTWTIRVLTVIASVLIVFALMAGSAFAQKYEVHPYAGGFFPGSWLNQNNIEKEGFYGVRGGVYVTNGIEFDGNFGYLNHFRFKDTADLGIRAFLWDFNGAYNFRAEALKRAEPFVTAGVGGLTSDIRGSFGQTVPMYGRIALTDRDTFLTLNYGGGIKGSRLWGPVGLRADFRGRTLPNFYGNGMSWFEVTAGVNFAWGER